ncbi:hypothetical protein EVAR_85276_1 [Eumeta japonica]|uniref:Uncharacterized protein n=1 Tax=Eumeta variegata TaxID=151549 RepID=A0A4C1V7V1_EUMVA|nr:hypothetical protein EVAR_85276_1 [Eumeta japonica]
MYGSWVLQKKSESRIKAVEMRSQRSMCGVSLKDRYNTSDVRRRCDLKENVNARMRKEKHPHLSQRKRTEQSAMIPQYYHIAVSSLKQTHRSGRASVTRRRHEPILTQLLFMTQGISDFTRVYARRNTKVCMFRLRRSPFTRSRAASNTANRIIQRLEVDGLETFTLAQVGRGM